MYYRIFIFFLAAGIFLPAASAQIIPDQYKNNRSFTYEETIGYYQQLDKKYKKAALYTYGLTDCGKPLHLFVISGAGKLTSGNIRKQNIPVLFILNGIHPGEPDGIDASLHLSEWLLSSADTLVENLAVCIIPSYNIDGMLNRGCCTRANQEGPEMYGFRGNARNLDLNRDYIKMDSKNARSLIPIIREWNPDFFIDTHVSNGADYSYTFTLLPTLYDKLNPLLRTFLQQEIWEKSSVYMKHSGYEMIPYIHSLKEIPDSGIVAFIETPRFTTGYTTLFNTIGVTTETHMLKPFPQRTESTLHFLKWACIYMRYQGKKLHKLRKDADDFTIRQQWYPIQWALDTSRSELILFKGYEAVYKTSEVTGMKRLSYDRSQPYTKKIRHYNHYMVTDSVKKPAAYIIPQAWENVISLLELNNIPLLRLENDTLIHVEAYRIKDYQTTSKPYEGHYLHSQVKTDPLMIKQQFYKGDAMVPTGTVYDYFLVSVLEPRAVDSYFCWGFFDAVLQQKEWFSDYVWEDKAAEILNNNHDLRVAFEQKKAEDEKFRNSAFDQLYYIYRNSSYYEPTHMIYPVYRLLK